MYYIPNSPSGGKIETKSKLVRQIGDAVDLSTFDYQSGRHQMGATTIAPNTIQHIPSPYQRTNVNTLRRTISDQTAASLHHMPSSPTPSPSSSAKQHQFEFRFYAQQIL